MRIDPKDYHKHVDPERQESFQYVTDQQVLEAHGRDKFTIFQKYMEGQTCPIFPCGKGDENFAACYAWDYEKWAMRQESPAHDKK